MRSTVVAAGTTGRDDEEERAMAAETADTAPAVRAPARRPRVVLVDVFETMLRVDALGSRFVDIGRPAEEGSCSSPGRCATAWR